MMAGLAGTLAERRLSHPGRTRAHSGARGHRELSPPRERSRSVSWSPNSQAVSIPEIDRRIRASAAAGRRRADGRMDFQQFRLSLAGMVAEYRIELLRLVFDQLDGSGTGSIGWHQLQDGCRAVEACREATGLLPDNVDELRQRARQALGSRPGPRYELSFSGCGGLWPYLFGIASVIQQRMDPLELQACAASGCSGGVYSAIAIASGYPAQQYWEYLLQCIDELAQGSWTGSLWNYNHFAKNCIERFWLTDFEKIHRQRMQRQTPTELSGSLAIALTRLSTSRGVEGVIISEWDSLQQIAQANVATHAIPGVLDPPWRLGHKVGGDLMVDGGLGGQLQPRAFDGATHFAIHPKLWRDFPDHWTWPSCDRRWLEYLYELGRSDCHAKIQLCGTHADLDKLIRPDYDTRRTKFPPYLGSSMAWRVWLGLKLLPPGIGCDPFRLAWRAALLWAIARALSRRWLWSRLTRPYLFVVQVFRIAIGACFMACHLCLKVLT